MRRNIVILANSRKMRNRCIAGMDFETGRWVRPCAESGEEGVPRQIRDVDGAEPCLLDIVSIPLSDRGPHRDIQPENRYLEEGRWTKLDTDTAEHVAMYCEPRGPLLHNCESRLADHRLQQVPIGERRSLCLIWVHVEFSSEVQFGRSKVFARFQHDRHPYRIPVTDAKFEEEFRAGGPVVAWRLLTVSLGQLYEGYYYKLVAGVIRR